MNNKSRRITIRDVAKELGVSTTTITRALNSKGRISEETKKLVTEAAMRMGYKPNRAAGSLARKTVNIATIFQNSFDQGKSIYWE
jgi:DNA-binding LacI/PurR family transcriptional regulator